MADSDSEDDRVLNRPSLQRPSGRKHANALLNDTHNEPGPSAVDGLHVQTSNATSLPESKARGHRTEKQRLDNYAHTQAVRTLLPLINRNWEAIRRGHEAESTRSYQQTCLQNKHLFCLIDHQVAVSRLTDAHRLKVRDGVTTMITGAMSSASCVMDYVKLHDDFVNLLQSMVPEYRCGDRLPGPAIDNRSSVNRDPLRITRPAQPSTRRGQNPERSVIEPLIVPCPTDKQMVEVVCPHCLRSDFRSTSGFIHHCRMSHDVRYMTCDDAVMACGRSIDGSPRTPETMNRESGTLEDPLHVEGRSSVTTKDEAQPGEIISPMPIHKRTRTTSGIHLSIKKPRPADTDNIVGNDASGDPLSDGTDEENLRDQLRRLKEENEELRFMRDEAALIEKHEPGAIARLREISRLKQRKEDITTRKEELRQEIAVLDEEEASLYV